MFRYVLMCVAISLVTYSQETPTTNQAKDLKPLVVSTESKPDAIVIPPALSVTFGLKTAKGTSNANSVDLRNWLNKESALNGLQSTDIHPWHIVITYDQFDGDDDNVHSGVYEEYWDATNKYKRIYKGDDFNQTDYATDKGLYRLGDQQWPNRAQSQVRSEVIDPFYYAATLDGFHTSNLERTFGAYKLQCVLVEKDQKISDPTQYCFESDTSTLRYSRGFGWFQMVYNNILPFQGRDLAQEVDVTDGGKPYLKLRVGAIELLSHVDEADFTPPPNAVGPLGDRVSGVHLMPSKTTSPQWPASMRTQHFTVTVHVLIGKDGRVLNAHGVSGPPEAYKGCEDAVRNWIFPPFPVLGKPVEVEQKVTCSMN